MKKLFLIVGLLLIANLVVAQDYWLYIRKQTKITDYNDPEQVAGLSDTDDVVEALPCTPQYVPTKKEKKLYKIVKAKDFTLLDKSQVKDSIRDIDGKIIKYRRYKIDITSLGVKEEFEKNEIQQKITDKIGSVPINFYTTP